jgi:chitinase
VAVLAASLLLASPALPAFPRLMAKQASAHPLLTAYFGQWGLYDQPAYLVKNLVTSGSAALLDRVNYAQGFVTDGHCSIADPNADLNYTFTAQQSVNGKADKPAQRFRGNLHQLVELKRRYPHLKFVISLEGRAANFAQDAQPENRQAFVRSCVNIFLKGNFAPGIHVPSLFDGIDVDWEYPHKEDAANYLALLTELRRQMDAYRHGLLLTVAVGPSPRMYEGTDMAAVSRVVDQVGLMTYDFNGPWSKTTGFIAPLLAATGYQGGTIDRTIAAYQAAGVPVSKLLMGIPFYGYGWRLVPEANHGLFQEGEAIHGDRPYSYIQNLVSRSTVYRDPLSQAPWLFDGDNFWTYEDPTSILRKTEFARQQKLGGLMIWELGEDTPSAALLQSAYHGLLATPGLSTPAATSHKTEPAVTTLTKTSQ